jgi:hypothetical protein
MLHVDETAFLSQVDRIIHSEELRHSEVQRRLLKFLADKSVLGEADSLKEYIVAIDGLGKPSSYDPRQNSAVRIQVGRLRQSLAEYYRTEGKQDQFLVELPKGHFKLTCEPRLTAVEPQSLSSTAMPAPIPPLGPASSPWRPMFLLLAGLAIGALSVYSVMRVGHASSVSASTPSNWTPDLQELWEPFVDSKLPLILTIEDPLFVELRSEPGSYYRDRSLNKWDDVVDSPAIVALKRSMRNANIQPSRYYTAYGEVEVAYHLGSLLGPREQNFSIVKTSQVSWQQLADNDIIFVGVQDIFFDKQLHDMPLEPQLVPTSQGIRNMHPKPGEPEFYSDNYSTAPAEEGVAYALVTHLPGPLRSHDIESFTSSRSAGYVGAVRWFTDAALAHELVAKLKDKDGVMPRYYQVLFKVRFRDDVPIETTYVLSQELH